MCTPRTASSSSSTQASSREYSAVLSAYSVWCYSVLSAAMAMPCHVSAMPCHASAMPLRVTSSRHHVRVSAGELTSSSKTSTVDSITFSRTRSGPSKRVWHSPQSTAPRTAQRKQAAERRRLIGASVRDRRAMVQQPAQDIPCDMVMRRHSTAYHLDRAADAVPPLGIPLGRVDMLVERDDVDPKQRLAYDRMQAEQCARTPERPRRVQTGEHAAQRRQACGGRVLCSVLRG